MSAPSDSAFSSQSLSYVENLYRRYLADSAAVPDQWREYFESQNGSATAAGDGSSDRPFPRRSLFNPVGSAEDQRSPISREVAGRQERLDQLIRNYRVRGHIIAAVNPLGPPRSEPPELDPAFYGFTDEDRDLEFSTHWFGGPEQRTLRAMLAWLRQTYCRSIGVQFMHIDSLRVREWLQSRMENTANRIRLSREEQLRVLSRLSDATVFEEFVARKYVGAKSFSLEGAESLIPLLALAIEKAGDDGVREIVIGMAHRGRLNVLANIMQKSPRSIFREFEDRDPELHMGRGDVKYHLGYSTDWETSTGKKVHLSLCFNPSHLEFVNPVALGRMRAKQDRFEDFERRHGCVILIHGDASFAGEGVVQETLNLSELPGYAVGGTIHIVVNNQIGFTTPPEQGRSSTYATDVAKMLQIPIFHVNGEDPEAVAQVISLASDFRREFQRDVVIDMYCYRRRGHNEGDEPEFTQPRMYRAIKERPSVFDSYLQHLLSLRGISREEAEQIVQQRKDFFEQELALARQDDFIRCVDRLGGVWTGYHGGPTENADHPSTGVAVAELSKLLLDQWELPKGFKPHPKIERLLDSRREMARGEKPLDWGTAEAAAFATILKDGKRLRLSGQDAERGTFSHRHAVLHDYETDETLIPLSRIAPQAGRVQIYNSPLSETAVLGFDYGYSLDCPDGLVMWEAQFGDFANAAQVIIDQFLSSAEDKWDRLSGLVMLLPHGFEGQGPEHSSARLERFLMLAAEDNILVAQPSTPAQYMHLLRRQALRKWMKPLIVMTPKSLLRHPQATSTLQECAQHEFQEVLADPAEPSPESVRLILLCSGKLYYDLAAHREEHDIGDVAILRLEQFYPFPEEELFAMFDRYPAEAPVRWIQEEPENMGAWRFLRTKFCDRIAGRHFSGVQRPISASPATGSGRSHKIEQLAVLTAAFAEKRR